jgi:hypothetical protein
MKYVGSPRRKSSEHRPSQCTHNQIFTTYFYINIYGQQEGFRSCALEVANSKVPNYAAIARKYNIDRTTLFAGIGIVDRYSTQPDCGRDRIQKLAATGDVPQTNPAQIPWLRQA